MADLLLAVAVVFLASLSGLPPKPVVATLTPTPTPAQAPKRPPAVEKVPLRIEIRTAISALLAPTTADAKQREHDRLVSEVDRLLKARLKDRVAGIVLLFGHSANPGEGGRLSLELANILRKAMPASFGAAVMRPFHQITADRRERGKVTLDIYLIGPA